VDRPNPQTRRRVIETLVVACVGLSAWIVVLGLTLPRRYDAAHWNLAWVGFDLTLLAGLIATAWAAWRRRVVFVLFATATSTLMLADTWFDVTTARSSDLWVSAIQAVLVEIPFAIFLLCVVVRVLSFAGGQVWSDSAGARARSLWSVEFAHPAEMGQRERERQRDRGTVPDRVDGQAD
jgi:hypothetical protein